MASLLKKCRHRRPDWDTCGCTWYIRRRQGGRDHFTPVGPDRLSAERALGRVSAEPGETVAEAVDLWIASKSRDESARSNSLASYRGRATHVRDVLGKVPVARLRPDHVSRFVEDLLAEGYRPATVQGIYALLTATLRHARRRGVIAHLPLPPDGPGIGASTPRRHELTLRQAEEVITRMPGVWGQIAELVLLTGLRWGEAVAVEPGDVDGHVLYVRRTLTRTGDRNEPKTKSGNRAVPLSKRALDILGELELPVGGDYRRARDALVHAMGDLHRPGMGWHTLRAAHAALLDVAGVSLRDSAARMGHGTHHAQTLQYALAGQAGTADAIDAARQHASPSSGGRGRSRRGRARARPRRSPP